MKDHTGKDISVGDYVRHVYEPLPPKITSAPGLGQHRHDFFGIGQVHGVMTQVVLVDAVAGGGACGSTWDRFWKSSTARSATDPTSHRSGSP
ncbi:hypothetical protein [Telmatospirillum sp.]|uniref:hypothetical protein n=1 Tax=Telmatospirillum sp. TaxID=2079197 RepID=UPI00283B3808|nr:hypothetical protein [Telmatospirillum sp.]MDR3437151.1 hypothetical protein [Telmatospirillum sp.]